MSAAAQREGDRDAEQALAGAADEIEERKIREKIAYSKGVVEQRSNDSYASTFEAQIGMDLDELRNQIAQAEEALDDAGPQPMEEALDRARRLARGTETLGRRLEQGGQGQQGDQQGQQQGQQGQSGQQGQQGQQGQSGQQGQQGQGQGGQGQNEGRLDPNAQGDARGTLDPRGGSGGGATRGGSSRPLTADEIRDFRREFQERLGDAQAMRRDLQQAGVDAAEMDEVLDALEQLGEGRPYTDLPELARLQSSLQENLQRLEFRLRRQVEGDGSDRAVLNGSDEVPEGFRGLVEEYFRALSRSGAGR
jgi:hypothetical protein